MKRLGWKARYAEGIEIFTSPEGREYIRATKGAPADLEIPLHNLPALRLVNIDHWKPPTPEVAV